MSAAPVAAPQVPNADRPLSVLIVGAGFGGIAAAIELKRHGIDEITILERAQQLGGTWNYNSYPGAACDVPSHLYSFSFAQRRDWTRLCSSQSEIHDYLRATARAYDVERHIELARTVSSCSWDERTARWLVETDGGERYSADALVLATGQLNQPALPAVEGIETFAGESFHSARWKHEHPLPGKRVAVVGTGASAVQFVPELAARATRLTVFQRTGNWMLPRRNRAYPRALRATIEHVPGVQAFRRRFMFEYCELITAAIRHPRTIGRLAAWRSAAFMRSQLKDPELRRKAWPDYTFGCKRVLFSSYYLPALQRPNVELVTDAIERVTPEGIVTAGGTLHELDCIVWGTGFKTTDFMFPMRLSGTGGADLREQWAGGAHAHLGMTVPRFPNMFLLYGPNTNTSGGSIIVYLEAQASYLRQALQQLRTHGAAAIEVREEVERDSDRELQERFAGTAWTRCDSWYRDERGRIVANWPGYMRDYLARTRELDPREYRFTRRAEPLAAEPGTMTRINYHREGSGPVLVLLHGIGLSWRIWRPLLALLAADHDVIACDSPGFGASPPLPSGIAPTIPAYADAFELFFAESGLERPHVAGNSMGGAIALELARRGAVSSATALSPAGFWTPGERRFCQRSLAPLARTPRAARGLLEATARSKLGRRALLWQTFARPELIPPNDAVEMLRAAWAAPAFEPALAAFDDYTFAAGEELRGANVTIAWGMHDRLLPYARQAPRARALLPYARHLSLDVGHVPAYDDPPVIAETLRLGMRG